MTRKKPECPVCGKQQDAKYKPFCSRRCSDVDLARWLGERYRIPTDEVPADSAWPPEEGEE